MSVALQEGRYYSTREGEIYGPLVRHGEEFLLPGVLSAKTWTASGRPVTSNTPRLVREAKRVDPVPPTKAWQRKPMTKHELLDLAKEAVADRGLNYGAPEDNFLRIARLWNTHMINAGLLDASVMAEHGKGVTPHDVACMMMLVKLARLENTPGHLDSLVDVAGYAACAATLNT